MRMTGAVETHLARCPEQRPLTEQDAGLEQTCLRLGIADAGRDDRQTRKRCPLVDLVGADEAIAGRQPIQQRLRVQSDEAEAGLRQGRQDRSPCARSCRAQSGSRMHACRAPLAMRRASSRRSPAAKTSARVAPQFSGAPRRRGRRIRGTGGWSAMRRRIQPAASHPCRAPPCAASALPRVSTSRHRTCVPISLPARAKSSSTGSSRSPSGDFKSTVIS